MLKIVPDPPLSPETAHSLEDLLIQISKRLFCALSVTHQNALTQVTSTARGMSMATMHEIEAARGLVELALSKLQIKH